MRRSPFPLFLLVFCLAFLLQPAPELLGAQSRVPAQPTNKQVSTSSTTKKTSAAAQTTTKAAPKTKTSKQASITKPPATATSKKISTKPPAAQQQTVKNVAVRKASQTSPAGKQAKVGTAKSGKRPSATVTASSGGKAKARRPALARTKPRPMVTPAAEPVERAGTVPEIGKQISARSVMVMDADSGEPLFEKMPDNPRQPASTIKIVTAMIALQSLGNDDVISVSRHAADMPSSKIFLDTSKDYQANDLINAVLLASANDASVALAEKIAGSEDKFATLMTISAKMWGAKNTICRTASGLTAVGQQSTARDLANLFRYAMQHDDFASRMREKFIRTSYGKNLRNHNKALWRLDGAVGGKTGYTVAARQTYVGQFTRDGQSIVVAIMGSESMWADLEKLVNYGFLKKRQEQVAGVNNSDSTTVATDLN
jgi:D-alanyl-D-alanine carboxypeptidase (penicillin-binding protein 5/6)